MEWGKDVQMMQLTRLNLQNMQVAQTTQQQQQNTTQWKNGQALINISPKKTYRWPVGI